MSSSSTSGPSGGPPKKPRLPVAGKSSLVLVIYRQMESKQIVPTEYVLVNLTRDNVVADPLWRLLKDDGSSYDVSVADGYTTCTCADFTYEREHKDPKGCKHIAALRQHGLLHPQRR